MKDINNTTLTIDDDVELAGTDDGCNSAHYDTRLSREGMLEFFSEEHLDTMSKCG